MAFIVVVGSLNADMVVRVPHIPAPGETILGSGFETIPGGKGANQAVAAARLGAEVAMIGRVGAGALGDMLLANLENDKVDHRWVRQDPDSPTGIAMIEVSEDGQNSIVVAPGANHRLTPQDVEDAESLFAQAKILLLQLEIPLDAVIAAAKLARKHQVKVLLNPAPAQPLPAELLSLVDILVPNETEAALLTNKPVDTLETAREAARSLQAEGPGTVIITLGERGCLVVDQAGERVFPAFPVQAVDTTAAGDAFIGAFAVAMAEGKPVDEALAWGRAAGALAASKAGAQPSLPSRAELLAFLARQ